MGAPLSDIPGRERRILSPNTAAPKEENTNPFEFKTGPPKVAFTLLEESKRVETIDHAQAWTNNQRRAQARISTFRRKGKHISKYKQLASHAIRRCHLLQKLNLSNQSRLIRRHQNIHRRGERRNPTDNEHDLNARKVPVEPSKATPMGKTTF